MKWLQIKIEVKKEYLEEVAAICTELGSGGSVIEDPDLIENYALSGHWDAWELTPDKNPAGYSVTVYFAVNHELEMKRSQLQDELRALGQKFDNFTFQTHESLVDQEDWANAWKEFFKVVKVGQNTVVKPSWEPYEPQSGEIVIEIDPGMAFGTGNHATTTLAMVLTERYLKEGMTVIDVGTGSGIIALQAALSGAEKVYAYDYDDVAVTTARENAVINGLGKRLEIRRNDLLEGVEHKADLLIANIVADIILRLLPQIEQRLSESGTVIVSGIIENRLQEVRAEINREGYRILDVEESEGWYALAFCRES